MRYEQLVCRRVFGCVFLFFLQNSTFARQILLSLIIFIVRTDTHIQRYVFWIRIVRKKKCPTGCLFSSKLSLSSDHLSEEE